MISFMAGGTEGPERTLRISQWGKSTDGKHQVIQDKCVNSKNSTKASPSNGKLNHLTRV